jgi:hypothetical protein
VWARVCVRIIIIINIIIIIIIIINTINIIIIVISNVILFSGVSVCVSACV